MAEARWEIIVRRCDNRLTIATDSGLIIFDQYKDHDPDLNIRLDLNEYLKAHPHTNVLTFHGFNGPSDPPDMNNPWRFEVEILRDGQTQKTMKARGGSQRNQTEVKVWVDHFTIRLEPTAP